MAYLNSKNISVFPTTDRPEYDPLGRLTTEYNLTSLLNTLLGVDGFVITDPGNAENTSNGNESLENAIYSPTTTTGKVKFQFNIKGYIFTIHDLSSLIGPQCPFENKDTIYAYIDIKSDYNNTNTSDNPNKTLFQRLSGGNDTSESYKNVTFLDLGPSDLSLDSSLKNYYNLKILEKHSDDGNWYIPKESKIKFLTTTTGNRRDISIDDGELFPKKT